MKKSIKSKIWAWLCDSTRLYFAPALGALKGAFKAYEDEIARQEAKRRAG